VNIFDKFSKDKIVENGEVSLRLLKDIINKQIRFQIYKLNFSQIIICIVIIRNNDKDEMYRR